MLGGRADRALVGLVLLDGKESQEPAADPQAFLPVQMTVREALNSAMEEEMTRDSTVFVLGEEVAQYNGAYKVGNPVYSSARARANVQYPTGHQGSAGQVRREACRRHSCVCG